MARCELQGFDDLMKCLDGVAENIDSVVEEALIEGGNVLRDNARSEVIRAANRKYATGELASSIIPTVPKKNSYGHFVAVRPVGTDSKGVRNGEKWGYLENGIPGKQEAHHFEDAATSRSEAECARIAQEVFDKYVKL